MVHVNSKSVRNSHVCWKRNEGFIYRGFLKWWYPTNMGFPTKNDHFGVFWGYHHLRKHPHTPQNLKIWIPLLLYPNEHVLSECFLGWWSYSGLWLLPSVKRRLLGGLHRIYVWYINLQGTDTYPPKKWHFESMIFRTSRLVGYVIVSWRVLTSI